MSVSEQSEVGRRLEELAARRQRQAHESDELAQQIRSTVREAQMEMSVAEIARRLGLDRSTLYRTYLDAPAA